MDNSADAVDRRFNYLCDGGCVKFRGLCNFFLLRALEGGYVTFNFYPRPNRGSRGARRFRVSKRGVM